MKRRYEKYRKYDVVYADFGNNPHGVQSGIRPGVIVSCDRSNHEYAPQVCIVPLSTKLKDNPVHVKLNPEDVKGYKLKAKSDFIPEDMQTVSKGKIRGKTGYIPKDSPVRDNIDRSLILQLDLLSAARKTNNKRFVRYSEGAEMYSMGKTKFQELAKDAKACYKVNQLVLVNLDILDAYLETFRITDEDFYK